MRLNREEAIIAGPSSGMNLMAAFKLVPDEPGNVVVVIFCDNIFKYASSVVKHFPELAPPAKGHEATGAPSKNDQFVAELMENLKNKYDTVKVKDLHEMLGADVKPFVIDIRIPKDYEDSHIEGSLNIPQADMAERINELPEDRDAPIVTVCNIGKFSKQVTLWLKSKGYRNVRSAKGGLNEWVRKGFETS
jgi:rhodanese-related sulfurtransferase